MADFFTSVGQTNTLSGETSRLSDLVLNMRKQKLQETQMGMEAQKLDLEKQNVTSQIQARNIESGMMSMKLNEARRQEEQLNKKIDIGSTLSSLPPSTTKILMDHAKSRGYLEPVEGTNATGMTNRNYLQMQEDIKNDPLLNKSLHVGAYNDSVKAIQQIQQQMADPKIKPDQKEALNVQLQSAMKHKEVAFAQIDLSEKAIEAVIKQQYPAIQEKTDDRDSLGLELFGHTSQQKPFTQNEMAAINKLKLQRDKETAAAKETGKIGADIAQTALSPEAVDAAATSYNMTGKMPSVGMGIGGVLQRKQILDRSAKMLKEEGLSNKDAVINQIKTKTTQTALNQLDKLRQYTNNFEERTNLLFDTLVPMRQKIIDSGIRSANTLINIAEGKVEGTPDQRELASQVYESMVDYGKVVTGQFSIAGMSDSARKETQQLLNAADREDTFVRLVGKDGRFRKNMTLTKKSYDDTYDAALVKLGGSPQKKEQAGAGKPAGIPPEYKQAPDGNYYAPDPSRPGKYLMWKQ